MTSVCSLCYNLPVHIAMYGCGFVYTVHISMHTNRYTIHIAKRKMNEGFLVINMHHVESGSMDDFNVFFSLIRTVPIFYSDYELLL